MNRTHTLWVAGLSVTAMGLLLLGGCSTEPDSQLGPSSEQQQRYIAEQGAVESAPAASRGQPITLSGTTLGGDGWSMGSVTPDEVTLVIAWASWCDTCRAQVGEVERASRQLQAQDVPTQVVGLDFMEDADAGTRFQLQHALDFPTLRYNGGTSLQAIPAGIPMVPTTLVLDRTRRIAARVVGPADAETLTRLVTDELAGR